ncbi:retroviral-like aspartic protease family protein [Phenylobacterium sp. J367]|uniref:retroviral-like aspartic protease family protein n=1 Tax=Phenylobacterium sp. J367 TaxID=2898435 RepID=UPI0021518CB2|nr:retroviral-like aspartic protease family protein [Phenylobacterium sp. J367]MCR5878793.1 aspartyl protease family protein [Phenylobacterium sp. J367]
MTWTRRGIAAALPPGLLGACATLQSAGPPIVSVNLLDAEIPPAPPPTDMALLETAFDEARRMTVPVYVDRKGPYPFVVDTGANRTVVSRELAGACSLPLAGRADVHGIAGVEPADLARVDRLRVGSVFSSGLELPVLPRTRLGADGLLGVDIFKNRVVRLDFAANRFEISASGRGMELGGRPTDTRIKDTQAPVRVPAQYRFGQLVILDAEVGGVKVAAFIDSGSQVTVGNRALREAAVRARPELAVRLAPVPLISATGQTARGEFATLPPVRLGGLAIHEVLGVFADLHIFDLWKLNDRPALLVGVDVLRHFQDVTLDFGRKQVAFAPRAPGQRLKRPS